MPNKFNNLNPSSDMPNMIHQINKNFAELDREAVTKVFREGDNRLLIGKTGDSTFGMKMVADGSTIEIGRLTDGSYGFGVGDGTITFLTITKDGIVLNDGTNDRILIGKDVGGF